jgi:antitoxin YefM
LEAELTIQTTYTQARDGLVKRLDQVTHNREIGVIHRRGEEDVAMIAPSELESLIETAYLLCSPANAERLLPALGRALNREGDPQSLENLCCEVTFEP